MAEGLKWRVNRAVRASKLDAPARLVMFVLSDMAEAKTAQIPDAHTPSLAQLADETGLNVATVKRHLASLEKSGWVLRARPNAEEKARHITTRYRLAIPSDGAQSAIESAEPMAQEEPSGGEPMAQSAPSDGAQRAIAMAHSAPSSHIYDRHNQLHDQKHTSEPEPSSALVLVADLPAPVVEKVDKTAADEAFDRFWRAYPKRVGKAAARRAWDKAIKGGADAEIIIGAAEFYALEKKMTDPQYLKHPQGWLNDGRWQDEPDPAYTPPAVPHGNGNAPNDYGSEAHLNRFLERAAAREATGGGW